MIHPRVEQLLKQSYEDQRTPEWHALRGTMLTASDLATAIGDNPYEKPSDLVVKKCGHNNGWKGNAATEHGTLLEPTARDLYDATHNQKSHEIGLVQHPVHKWLGGSPDGVTESGRLIEIKCPLTRKIEHKCPKYYLPQIQLLLEVLDLEVCDFIQYRPAGFLSPTAPEEFDVIEIPRDRIWFARILPRAKAFWDEVLERRKFGLCEVVDENDENVGVLGAALLKEIMCEVVEDNGPVSKVSEESGSSGTYVSRMFKSLLHKVYPTGDAPVSTNRRPGRVRAVTA